MRLSLKTELWRMEISKHKKILHDYCDQIVSERIATCRQAILQAKEAHEQETKSTAGDKHETGRAMVQLELEKLGRQIREWEKQALFLKRLRIDIQQDKAVQGSIVETNRGNFYLATASGKYKAGDREYYIISVESPIAKELFNRKAGDTFRFNNMEYMINKVS